MTDTVVPTATTTDDQSRSKLPDRRDVDSAAGPMSRWVKVLEAFTKQDQWGVRELAANLSVSPSVSHRILHDMQRLGLLVPADQEGRFRVGPELARIAVLTAKRSDMTNVARPLLRAAASSIGETVILIQYSNHRRQFWAVDAAESNHTVRYIWESLQQWSDLYVGSSGKAILAFLDQATQDEVIAGLPDPIPAARPISKDELRADLELTRQRGYAISHGERYSGAVGVGAPVREAGGRIVGAIVASWPDNRTDRAKEERTASFIVEAAAVLSRDLGYRIEDSL
jgi:DNA-binding IclR family transcriptional regulator